MSRGYKPRRGRLKRVPYSAIEWFMGNVHVSVSRLGVCREMRKRLRAATPTPTRAERRECYRYALLCHQLNQRLYGDVMRGSFR